MLEKVRRTMEEFHMCTQGERLVVGVSGGADSMALLHILWTMAQGEGYLLQVVHVHHGLRGAEADGDCAFVELFCKERGIDCKTAYFDVKKEAEQRGLGEEETGRELRYAAFRKEAQGGKIAVAHNQNDQAETVLMRLARGTGLSGLVAMEPIKGDILRPLLFCSREEIESYCKAQGISYREDSTNRSQRYTRNKMRQSILPLLEEIYPKAVTHIAMTAHHLLEEEAYLQTEGEACLKEVLEKREENKIILQRKKLSAYPKVLQKRVFLLVLEQLGGRKNIGAVHLEKLAAMLHGETGKPISLPHGLRAENIYEALMVYKEKERVETGFEIPLEPGKEVYISQGDFFIKATIEEKNGINGNNLQFYGCMNVFDYDKIKDQLFCRSRKEGDYIAIRQGRKKLKDFFIDEKIPREERDETALIACGSEIIWIIGKRKSTAYTVASHTERILKIQIRRREEDEGAD